MAGWVAQDIAGHVASTFTTKAMRHLALLQPLVPPNAGLVRPILSAAAGVLRNGAALATGADRLHGLIQQNGAASDPALVAWKIVTAAQRRTESRGSHFRTDYPARNAAQSSRQPVLHRELERVA